MKEKPVQCIDCVFFIKSCQWPKKGLCNSRWENPPPDTRMCGPRGYKEGCNVFQWRWILFERK